MPRHVKELDRFQTNARRNMPLKWKLIAMMIGSVIFSAVFISIIALAIFGKNQMRNTERDLEYTANGVIYLVEDWTDNVTRYSNILSYEPETIEALKGGNQKILDEYIKENTKIFGLDIPLMGNAGSVVLGMVYNYLPFMVLPLHAVMLKIDDSLIEAAKDLGAGKFNVFRKVVFPLSVSGIISGFTMVFVPTASTFLVAQYLGGTGDKMIGDVIENIFQRDKNVGSAISLALMVIILILVVIMNKFGDEEAAVA